MQVPQFAIFACPVPLTIVPFCKLLLQLKRLVDRYLRCFFNIFLFFYFGRGVEMGVDAVPVFAHVPLSPFILK